MKAIAAGLYVFAYLSAVVDGSLQDKGTYPSSGGRVGLKNYARKHPWVVVGAGAGAAATIIAFA
jgi:hypothetical protein